MKQFYYTYMQYFSVANSMYTHRFSFYFCHVSTDLTKSSMQENLRYKDSRLHKGLHLKSITNVYVFMWQLPLYR